MIHFPSSDGRFCGSTKQFRQFTFDPNEVTCARCKAHDTFALSQEAQACVRELEEAAQ